MARSLARLGLQPARLLRCRVLTSPALDGGGQFATLLSVIFRGDNDEIVELWFRMYDTDHDGLITKHDFEELLHDVAAGSKDQFNSAAIAAFMEYSADGVLGEGIEYIDFQVRRDTGARPGWRAHTAACPAAPSARGLQFLTLVL